MRRRHRPPGAPCRRQPGQAAGWRLGAGETAESPEIPHEWAAFHQREPGTAGHALPLARTNSDAPALRQRRRRLRSGDGDAHPPLPSVRPSVRPPVRPSVRPLACAVGRLACLVLLPGVARWRVYRCSRASLMRAPGRPRQRRHGHDHESKQGELWQEGKARKGREAKTHEQRALQKQVGLCGARPFLRACFYARFLRPAGRYSLTRKGKPAAATSKAT